MVYAIPVPFQALSFCVPRLILIPIGCHFAYSVMFENVPEFQLVGSSTPQQSVPTILTTSTIRTTYILGFRFHFQLFPLHKRDLYQ